MVKPTKVAIVAKGQGAGLAPWSDPDWEIWGLAWVKYPRVDVLVDPHNLDHTHDPLWWEEYAFEDMTSAASKELMSQARRVVLEKAHPDYPHSEAFPLAEVAECLGRRYFESTVAYMIGLAIFEGWRHIGLWGVQMGTTLEYIEQRPNIEWLIGLAEGRGIKIELMPGSRLCMSHFEAGVYGVNMKRRWMGLQGMAMGTSKAERLLAERKEATA